MRIGLHIVLITDSREVRSVVWFGLMMSHYNLTFPYLFLLERTVFDGEDDFQYKKLSIRNLRLA